MIYGECRKKVNCWIFWVSTEQGEGQENKRCEGIIEHGMQMNCLKKFVVFWRLKELELN